MKGTIHQDDWFFYHDALSLMTSNECFEYMRKKSFNGCRVYDKWLLPRNGVNRNTPYDGRCVGNSPEMMPLDNSLNDYLKESHKYHCICTAHLPTDDPRKHSLSTPLRIAE